MKRCEIISNFNSRKFNDIKNNFSLKNVVFFSDDDTIQAEMMKKGYNSKDLRYYSGYNSSRAVEINKNSINLTQEFQEKNLGNEYGDIEISKAMKLTIIRDIRLINWCYNALLDYENVIFLFKKNIWWQHCILEIAIKLDRESKFGVSEILDKNLISINFDKKWRGKYPLIYELLNKSPIKKYGNNNQPSFSAQISKMDFEEFENSEFGFFLVNDATGFYVKSIWKILDFLKEKNTKISLFTFTAQADEQVKEKGYQSSNIEFMIYDLYPKMKIVKKESILKYYFIFKRWKKDASLDISIKKNHMYKKALRFSERHKNFQNIVKKIYPVGGIVIIPYRKFLGEKGIFPSVYKKILFYFENKFEDLEDVLVGTLSKKEATTIHNFFNKMDNISTENIILKSYLKYFLNDIKISDITRIMLKIAFYNHMFKKTKWRAIIVSADGTQNNHIVCTVAERMKIPTYQFAPSHTAFTKIHTFFFNASKIFVGGIKPKEKIINCGINKDRLIITGEPKYDYLKRAKKIKNQKKLILLAPSRWKDGDEVWMSKLIKHCNEKNYDIIIRPHPSYSVAPARIEEGKRKLKEIDKRCAGLNYKFSVEGQLSDVLKKADIMITDFSTSGIETCLSNIPLVLANIGKTSLEWGDSYIKENVVLHAETLESLIKCIQDIFHNQTIQDKLQRYRDEFSFNFNYLNDGKATERVVEAIYGKKQIKNMITSN